MSNFSALGTALLVVLLIIFVPKILRRMRARHTSVSHIDVEGDLLSACRGDRVMAERLVRHELTLKPDLSRTGAALMALSRLRDDNR
jgi:hypothetical protein